MRSYLFNVFVAGLMFSTALHAQARIEGQVLNETTNNPVVNQDVTLLVPRQGMEGIANTTTDAKGHFVFDQSDIDPKGLYLVEALSRELPYHAPVLFQSSDTVTADLSVHESTSASSILRVSHLLILTKPRWPRDSK